MSAPVQAQRPEVIVPPPLPPPPVLPPEDPERDDPQEPDYKPPPVPPPVLNCSWDQRVLLRTAPQDRLLTEIVPVRDGLGDFARWFGHMLCRV